MRIDTTDWLVIRTVDMECQQCGIIWVVEAKEAPAWCVCHECDGKLIPKPRETV